MRLSLSLARLMGIQRPIRGSTMLMGTLDAMSKPGTFSM